MLKFSFYNSRDRFIHKQKEAKEAEGSEVMQFNNGG